MFHTKMSEAQPHDFIPFYRSKASSTADQFQTLAHALEAADLGMMLTDGNGQVTFETEISQSRRLLVGLRVIGGALRGKNSFDNRMLEDAYSLFREGRLPLPHFMTFGNEAGPCGKVSLSPLPPFGERHAILIFYPVTSSSNENALPDFSATPAEGRLLAALVRGERLSSYARRNSISPNTAKSHLHSLFDKTGARRQIDLIRLVLQNPALRAQLA